MIHGETCGGIVSPEHLAWTNMKNRCLNPNNENYPHYGRLDRGMTIEQAVETPVRRYTKRSSNV